MSGKFALPTDRPFEPYRSEAVLFRKRALSARRHETTADFASRVVLNLDAMIDAARAEMASPKPIRSRVHWDPTGRGRKCVAVVEILKIGKETT